MVKNAKTATTRAMIAGNQKALCHWPPVKPRPTAAATPTPMPPTLCAVFQMAVFQPRSFVENQCTSTRPQGGQPMPCTQPLMNMTSANEATVADAAGTHATTMFATADRAKPMGRNNRALERSETVAMKNFEKP